MRIGTVFNPALLLVRLISFSYVFNQLTNKLDGFQRVEQAAFRKDYNTSEHFHHKSAVTKMCEI